MASVRVAEERLYSEERERKEEDGNQERGTGPLTSMEKQKRDSKLGNTAVPNPAPLGGRGSRNLYQKEVRQRWQ
jgi:hypothetical protein